MKRWHIIVVIFLLMISGVVTPGVSRAERDRPFRIGVLTASWGPTPQVVGLRDGLQDLGYREDKDFVLGIRFTQGNLNALPVAARELIQYGVDVIIVDTGAPAVAAQQATTQIPIVFLGLADPIGIGLIQNFSRPGGNITGITGLYANLASKRLELFQELIPALKRVLFPYDLRHHASVTTAKAYRNAARRLGIVLVEKALRTSEEAQAALTQVDKSEVNAILQPESPGLNVPGLILKATTDQGIPSMFNGAFWAESGALASYGPDQYGTGHQAARLVDKILKGVNPAEIPVEVDSKIEFVINLKTAKALGLTIPPEVLFQADRIIR